MNEDLLKDIVALILMFTILQALVVMFYIHVKYETIKGQELKKRLLEFLDKVEKKDRDL